MAIKPNYQKDADNVVAVQTSKDPIEQQILAAGNLSEAQVEAIRGFQRRKGLTFGEAAIALGLVRRDSLFLALSKRYNYPVLNFGVDEGRFSRELVVGYQPFSTAAEAFRSVRSALATGPLSQGKNAFAVIGPHARVGVTYFAANLALSFAQMAVPTLLVDSNLRKPRLASLFGVDPKTEGLAEALTHRHVLHPLLMDALGRTIGDPHAHGGEGGRQRTFGSFAPADASPLRGGEHVFGRRGKLIGDMALTRPPPSGGRE